MSWNFVKKDWWKFFIDIIIPIAIFVMGWWITASINYSQQKLSALQTIYDKIDGTYEERQSSLKPLLSINREMAREFEVLGDTLSIERNVRGFYGGDVQTRVAAMKELMKIYDKYPEKIITRIADYIPEDKDEWAPIISITSFIYKVDNWKCTEDQYRKFESLRESKYYRMPNRNVKKYLEAGLNKAEIIKASS